MSLAKIAGIETEYGVMILGSEQGDPFLAARLLLAAYRQVGGQAVPCHASYATQSGYDIYSTEPASAEAWVPPQPLEIWSRTKNKARRGQRERVQPPVYNPPVYGDTSLMLANGARFYIDHTHPEYSTPECLSSHQLVAADKAGEQILAACQRQVNTSGALPAGQQLLVYKNNSDHLGNSYGCHENYLLSAELFNDLLYRKTHQIFRYLLPFLVTRPILCGAGKVGSENHTSAAGFQLSQRADFFEMLVGLQTTHQRPLFNTRDEPHADANRFRRLHMIVGDANMAEFSTYLKIGTTQLLLHMLEDGFIRADLTLNDSLNAAQSVSRDLTFRQPLQLEDGRRMTALEIQEIYLDLAHRYLEQTGGSEEQWDVWQEWADVLERLPDDWQALATRLDWAIKRRVLERYLDVHQLTWGEISAWQPIVETTLEPVLPQTSYPPWSARREPASSDRLAVAEELTRQVGLAWKDYPRQREAYFDLRRFDLEYHDIRQETGAGEVGLFYRLQQRSGTERLLDDDEIEQMVVFPPPDTRSWLRGECIARFADTVVAADWSQLHFRTTERQYCPNYILNLPDLQMGTKPIFRTLTTE
jgi:proteasome accessory factor A